MPNIKSKIITYDKKLLNKPVFNKRYANHKRSFSINRYKNETKLLVEYWNFKAGNSKPKVTRAEKSQFNACNP